MSSPDLPTLSVTSLSQYVRYNNCDRYLRLRLRPDEERQMRQRWGITIQPLTPLLREAGLDFEQTVETAVDNLGEQVVRLGDDAPVSDTLAWLRVAQAPVILLQAPLEARLGNYQVNGIADLIRIWRDDGNELHLFVADIKSSVKEKMEHRLQVALYVQILQEMVAAEGLHFASINGRIIHAGAPEFLETWDFAEPGFDLLPYITTLNQLLLEDASTIGQIAGKPFEAVFYHLGPWCDGCLYNALCLYDAAENQDLSLVPSLSAMEKRALNNAGVHTLPQLATLMDLPEKGSSNLNVAPGQEAVYQQVNQQWAIGPKLPFIVQRARRALRRFDRSVNAPPFLYGSGFGTLPDEEAHPGLVKIFLDAQYDYLQQRVYLASALITGPKGEQMVVRCLEQPPTAESERALLVDWVQGILQALLEITDRPDVFLHLYSYNSYDQRVLLEAFKRHLDEVALLPGFFDLMTQSPAVTQPIISFLAQELEERKNLGALCMPLHDAARALGFDWADGDIPYYELFRARMFDNRRDIVRRHNGEIIPAPPDVPRGDPRRATIESASRFNSQIPLEYAYAAWGRLISKRPEDKRLLVPFQQVTLEHMRGFASKRLHALAHIEKSFDHKSRYLDKERIDLNSLYALLQPAPSRAQSLQQFLFMEHYAAFQAKLQVYSLPIDRRVQTGLALLLRYEGYDDGRDIHRFAIETAILGLDAKMIQSAFRLKEGSWIVFNEAMETTGSRLKNGRLGIVVAVGESWLELS
ncbi:MAG: PD-(D/E)XK nuclease family protein, partial [Candidatus Promineifilaceae bacterium]